MASSVFLDTNGWLALLHSKDVNHAQAMKVWGDIGTKASHIVLTDWIIAETGNGLARTRIRHLMADAVDRIWQSPTTELVVVDRRLIEIATNSYRQHNDNYWGLVDCLSFVVMRELGITQAFTSDQHFEQAGFVRLLSA